MPLFYNKVQRVNPRDPKGARKWYPILKSVGQVDEHDVAKMLSDETTLNPKEAEMAVYQLEKVVSRMLLDGHTVQLGDLGTFNLTITAEGRRCRQMTSRRLICVSVSRKRCVKLSTRPYSSLSKALPRRRSKIGERNWLLADEHLVRTR